MINIENRKIYNNYWEKLKDNKKVGILLLTCVYELYEMCMKVKACKIQKQIDLFFI